jgi:hypothetical protein
MPSLGWLLYLPIDWQPPKAKAPIFSLFFDGVCVCTPNKGTDNGEWETATGRLAWAHRERWHQDLGPCQQLPWRERTTRLGGRAVLSHVGCFRLCVLCCGHEQPFRATNTTYLVESWYWISPNGQLLRTHNKGSIKQHPLYQSQRASKSLSFLDFEAVLTFFIEWCGPFEECATSELLIN